MCDGLDCTDLPYASVIDSAVITSQLRDVAMANGAAAFGVTSALSFPEAREKLRQHKKTGLSGPLHFTYDNPEMATDVRVSFPWARSLLVVAYNYLTQAAFPADRGAVVGRFATADHYRGVRGITDALVARLSADGHLAEVLIDDNRLTDRAAAVRAGVGWTGKSTMVLTPGHGPWLLLGTVVTDAELDITPPMVRDCGTCVECIPACPTGAITPEGLDARRCLSTWLQTPGSIPHWIRPKLGRRIYGCDDCLTSCPPGRRLLHVAGTKAHQTDFNELLALDDPSLVKRFSWWYIPRRDARFIRRNLLVAAGNSGESEALSEIRRHLRHRSALIRSHAGWAMARTGHESAKQELTELLDSETAPETRDEIVLALLMVERPDVYREILERDKRCRNKTQSLALSGLDPHDRASSDDIRFLPGLEDKEKTIEKLAGIIPIHDPTGALARARFDARRQLGDSAPGGVAETVS